MSRNTLTQVEDWVTETPLRPDPLDRLTARELDVLAFVAEGWSNDGIAGQFRVTARTVETHVSRIFLKLGLEASTGTHRRVLAALAYLQANASLVA
jgi:DNA-binding NarL/FixJ family response regulator